MAAPPITTKLVFEVDYASIEFKINGVVVTEYVLENNVVSVPAISAPVETDIASHRSSLQQLLTWANFAQSEVDTTPSLKSPFKLEIENDAQTLQVKFSIETSLLTDASYDKATQLITWQPHPAATLEWSDFKHWLSVLSNFSQLLTELADNVES